MIYITVCLILYPITLPFAGLCRSPAYNENKLNELDTIHFVRALEILQSMKGKFTTLILDDHTVH